MSHLLSLQSHQPKTVRQEWGEKVIALAGTQHARYSKSHRMYLFLHTSYYLKSVLYPYFDLICFFVRKILNETLCSPTIKGKWTNIVLCALVFCFIFSFLVPASCIFLAKMRTFFMVFFFKRAIIHCVRIRSFQFLAWADINICCKNM